MSTVSECSETVGGLLCGQQQFPQNNTHYTPLAFTREVIAFYTVIITLNNSLFKLILCRLLAAGCAATKYGVLYINEIVLEGSLCQTAVFPVIMFRGWFCGNSVIGFVPTT